MFFQNIFLNIILIEKRHPYLTSFFISFFLVTLILFYSPSLKVTTDLDQNENIQIINIDKVSSPKRVVKKKISKVSDKVIPQENVSRAVGSSVEEQAVDLAFYPNVTAPKPVGRLRKLYPKIAKEKNIEALINLALLISVEGKVLKVEILDIRLSKNLPAEIYEKISQAFSRDAVKILQGAQFTPAIVDGQKVPIKMELPLKFRLED